MATLRDPRVRPLLTSCLTLAMAIGVYAISFGVASVAVGASVAQTCALSLLVFTGASQFSAVAVVAAGGSAASAMSGALLLAARNTVFGLTMSRRLTGRLPKRLLAAQLVIDESTAMSTAQDEPQLQRLAFWITGGAIYIFWNLGTLIGALAGNAIDPRKFGLDAAIPAAFVAMLWPQLRTVRARLAAAIGATLCLITIPFLPIGMPILIASFGVLVGIPEPKPSEGRS